MRVALVAGVNPWSPRASGIRSYVVGLADALRRLGHEVSVIGAGRVLANGLSYRFLSVCRDANPSTALFERSLVTHGNTLPLGDAIVHAQRPDDLAALLLRDGVRARILTIHGMSYRGIHERHGWMAAAGFRVLERTGVRSADRIVVLDPMTLRELTETYPAVTGRIASVPAGVDLDQFQILPRPEARRALGLPDVSTAAFVGRLAPEKNLSVVLEAVAASGVGQLVIAGDGPLRGLIESASFPRLGIHFLGAVEHSRIPLVLNAAECLVLPSHREAMPSVCLESLACGTPVVATQVGGLTEIIRDGVNGFLTTASLQDFARGVEKAVDGSDRMRQACRASVEQFGWDHVATQMVRVYEEASS